MIQNDTYIDIHQTLAQIRCSAIDIARQGWIELGEFLELTLPAPISPISLLPVATGIATGGKVENLYSIAALILLFNLSLRIIDDYADGDEPDSLDREIGGGMAVNYAVALNQVAVRELWKVCLSSPRLLNLFEIYFDSFLSVCQGQQIDMNGVIDSLEAYKKLVKLKTVTAYEFAAMIGAYISTNDVNQIILCRECGNHLGWMAQILDDIEALWFPVSDNQIEVRKLTYPVLIGLNLNNSNSQLLSKLYKNKEYDRLKICKLLDEMNIRVRLMNLVLDHRDQAIENLSQLPIPDGKFILEVWLNWLLQDGQELITKSPL